MGRSKRERRKSKSGDPTLEGAEGLSPVSARRQSLPASGVEALTDEVMERILNSNRFLLVGRLSAPAAHDIINTDSAVVNLATLMRHLLQKDEFPAERTAEFRGFLSQIIGEATRAGRIASELLAFARASIREPTPADPNEIVRRTYALASSLFKAEDVECRCALADGLPLVRCDHAQVQQALLNLVINAVEAVDGCPRREIILETIPAEEARGVILLVQDTGIGITSEQLPRIFDPFFTTKSGPEHLGVGLTIARRIAAAHRGFVSVESRLGQGCTFRLMLPRSDSGDGA